MVFGCEDEVLHTGVFCDLDPFVGVELYGIELLIEVVVFFDGDFACAAGASSFTGA